MIRMQLELAALTQTTLEGAWFQQSSTPLHIRSEDRQSTAGS